MVVPLSDEERPRARELAASALDLVRAHVGLPRGALLEAWQALPIAAAEQRLARGLFKLALDACDFEEGATLDPVELRRAVFGQAAQVRSSGGRLDRSALLAELARARDLEVDALEEALYADLPTAHVLRRAELPSPDGLLAQHELACQQAVLLRAVHVSARVWNAGAHGYRTLFRALKFHRLLYAIGELPRGRGYAIDIDGPMSLFEQTTKYGLALALVLPALMACDTWELRADVRWGKERRPLQYLLRGSRTCPADHAALPDDVAALLADLVALGSPWQAAPAEVVFSLPGVGVCVPDLELVHRQTGRRAYVEVLGFWSRAAVWKRVELAQAGLPFPVVFAVSKHLRVSEEVIPDDVPAALYVYARTMNARALVARVEASCPGPSAG